MEWPIMDKNSNNKNGAQSAGNTHDKNHSIMGGLANLLRTKINSIWEPKHNLNDKDSAYPKHAFMQDRGHSNNDIGQSLFQLMGDMENISEYFETDKTLKNEHIGIRELLHEPMCIIKNKVKEFNIHLMYEVENTRLILNLDAANIKSCITKVVQNSLDNTDAGSAISVVSGLDKEGNFCIRVDDNGFGFSAQNLAAVNDSLECGDDVATGYGLSIVSQHIRQHGGRVYIDSTQYQGTSVIMILPKTCIVKH